MGVMGAILSRGRDGVEERRGARARVRAAPRARIRAADLAAARAPGLTLQVMPAGAALRFTAIIIGTVLWDAGAVLQKGAVDLVPGRGLGVRSLLSSPRWMAGLAVTAAGWGLYVFGLQDVGVSAARTITGGSYVVLALFSIVFLRARLSLPEWAAVGLVTAGILFLGWTEPVQHEVLPPDAAVRILCGIAAIVAACGALLLGGLALGEPVAGAGSAALVRLGGFLLVLVGSLLLGRFGAGGERGRQARA
jgi:drug/metabolite transporter (DMT)-like permease